MPTKVVLDGALFSECELMGTNRYGMLRVAEDVTKNIVKDKDIEVSFANTTNNWQHEQLLKKYTADNFPAYTNKIYFRKPYFSSSIPKWGGLLKRISRRLSLEDKISGVEKNDVFHSYYYPFPDIIANKKIKKSITFLDIISLRINGYPEELIQRTKEVVESIVPNFAIAISEYSKQDLLNYNKAIDPNKVFVTPLAASKELFYKNDNKQEWETLKRKYSLPDNYFLSVSSSDHRKNLHHLIKSFNKFVLQQKPSDLFLVLTGNSTYSYSVLDDLKIDKTVKEKIVITGKHIDDKDLAAIYSNARCFFFMSRYEGFGLPVLEAMQCGAPVVTANTTSLPEVVGDAGIMLAPDDEEALCDAMNTMHINTDMRDKFAQLGFERAKQFSWQRCAQEYADIFKTISKNF